MPFGPKQTMGISGHCSKAWSIGPRRVGPRHGDLVQGMFGPRHGLFWSDARSGNGPRDRLRVTVRYNHRNCIKMTETGQICSPSNIT